MIFSVVVLVVDCCQDDLVEYALFCKADCPNSRRLAWTIRVRELHSPKVTFISRLLPLKKA